MMTIPVARKTIKFFSGALAVVATLTFLQPVRACTDFQVKANNGTIIAARSMEWGMDMQSQLRVHARQEKCQSLAADGHPGLCWQSKYGYVGANCYGRDMVIDGINEKGLSAGGLWFPSGVYPQIQPKQYNKSINVIDLVDWILGNFATVNEVKAALYDVAVWAKAEPEIKEIPVMHFALHDDQGKNAVIEFANGRLKFYDNPNGVLTNAPSFDWHITNLRNYLMLTPDNPQPLTINGTVLEPAGQGSGFMGIPGDWTPPSRFVRTTAMLHFAKPVADAKGGVNLAEHILNAVDIPLGNIRPSSGDIKYGDYTQWAIIKDLTNKVLYFRSYENLSLQCADLKQIDFSANTKPKSVPIAGAPVVPVMTF